jgi:hypothetical protein
VIVLDIGYVISDSLKYPTSDWKRMSALGLLLFASIFIIPLFFALGYLFRVIKASLAGSEELPAFEEWGGMFVDGIKVFLVYLLYTLPAIIIGIYSLVVLFSTLYSLTYLYPTTVPLSNATLINSILGGSVIFGIIFSIIYIIVIYPIIAVALGNMAFYDGEFGTAFNLSEILSTISQIGWVDLIIWYIVVGLVATVILFIGGILNIIPIIGFLILILIVYPYTYIFISRAIAWLYASAFDEEYVP